MEKRLFAKTQAIKFLFGLFALVPMVAMLASCNFVGGADARKTIGGINSAYVSPKGFFKSLEGTSPQIWENTFRTNDRSAILAGSQGWWGGAWGLFDNGVAIDSYFDMQNVSYATCDINASENIKEFYIAIAADNSSKYSADPLTSGKHKIEISCNLTKRYVNPILTMGGVCNEGATIVPSNFAFYDKDGNEILPPIVGKKDIEDKKDIFDENDTTEGIEWAPTGMMTWASNGGVNVNVKKVENMGFTGITVGCTGDPSWAGLGIGMISYDGTKIENFIDVTEIKSVEFDVFSQMDGTFDFIIQSSGDYKGKVDDEDVEYKAKKTIEKVKTEGGETISVHMDVSKGYTYDDKGNVDETFEHENWTDYLYLLDGINSYPAETPIVITNLVFKDKDGNPITKFATRLNAGEGGKIYGMPVTERGEF